MKFNQLTILLAICIGLSTVACSQGNQTSNQTNSNQAVSNQTASGSEKSDNESDISKDNSAIKALGGNDEKLRQQTLDEVLSQPNDYSPVVLCVLSRELFEQEKRDEAAFWFYTCQLRARIDSKLTTDVSATSAVGVLNQTFGPNVNKYAFKDLNNLEKIVNKVVEFVRNNPENYDRNWMNLYGLATLEAAMKKKEAGNLLKPKSEWEAIKKDTIDNYYKDFLEAKKKMEEQKPSSGK